MTAAARKSACPHSLEGGRKKKDGYFNESETVLGLQGFAASLVLVVWVSRAASARNPLLAFPSGSASEMHHACDMLGRRG